MKMKDFGTVSCAPLDAPMIGHFKYHDYLYWTIINNLYCFGTVLLQLTNFDLVWDCFIYMLDIEKTWNAILVYSLTSNRCNIVSVEERRNVYQFPYLPYATKLWQGNIFTGVCQQGGCLPQCMLGYTPGRHPPGRHPPGQNTNIICCK